MAKPDYSKLFAQVEKQHGLPAGSLDSIRQQETGGQSRFDADPAAFHYSGDKPKSSARGLFGVLKGTARDPGYGVKPLTDWSVESQANFAASYLKALEKKTGSLEGGLAAYGEGPKYAAKVLGRIPGANTQVAEKAPVVAPKSILAMPDDEMPSLSSLPMAQAPVAAQPVRVAAAQVPVQQAPQAVPVMNTPTGMDQQVATAPVAAQGDQWAALKSAMAAQSMQPADLNFGGRKVVPQQLAQIDMGETAGVDPREILRKFGLGMYAQDQGRYKVSIPEFVRTDEYTG